MKVPLRESRTAVIGGASVLRRNQWVRVTGSVRFFMSKRSPFALVCCLALFTTLGAMAATISTTTHTTSSTHKSRANPLRITSLNRRPRRKRCRACGTAARPSPVAIVQLIASPASIIITASASTPARANDQVEGDVTAGEDPVVRAAAIEALGNMNGTVVAIDPDSGRILAMVNQKLALSSGRAALLDH